MSQLVDYAWQKPSPAQIVAAGYAGALRYVSLDASKNLTPAERDGLLAAGLAIGLVWETTAGRAAQGYGAGQQDVQAANAQVRALGYPASVPLFFAVDSPLTVAQVTPYAQGWQGLAEYPVGVYGDADIIEGITLAPWKWQTCAWSNDRISPEAHIYQTTEPSLPGCDMNHVLKPIPLWTASTGVGGLASGVVTIPAAPNLPTPTIPTIQEEDMSLVTFNVSDGTKDVAVAGRVGDVIGVFGSTEELECVQVVASPNPGEVNTRQLDLYHQWWDRSTSVASLEAQIQQLAAGGLSGADVAAKVVADLAAKLAA